MRLDQHRGADGAARQIEQVLGDLEDLVPERAPRRGSRASAGRSRGRCRGGRAPRRCGRRRGRSRRGWRRRARRRARAWRSTRCQPRGRTISVAVLLVETIVLAFGAGEGEVAPHRVDQVRLAVDDVLPGGRERVLEVGHEGAGARVEGVDHHLALDRAGDLDPSVLEVGGSRRHLPGGIADRAGVSEEIRAARRAAKSALAQHPLPQQVDARQPHPPLELGQEFQRFPRQHALRGVRSPALDTDAVHGVLPVQVVVSSPSGRGTAPPRSIRKGPWWRLAPWVIVCAT